MKRSGFLIRFVDVVLILLFGFIAISEIKLLNNINLAESTTTRSSISKAETVFIGVSEDGNYLVEGTKVVTNIEDLNQYIQTFSRLYQDTTLRFTVRVLPDSNAQTDRIKDILRLCDRYGITTEVGVERFVSSIE